ncbi:MAG: DUF1934 domain-containing protein [Clostridia bacterium]|nr:DUF1934 domain-containing protein [Clostridia bacterium]
MNEMKRPVSIHLRSIQQEASNTELFRGIIEAFGDEMELTAAPEEEDTLLEIRAQGTLTRTEDGRISLSYDETELTGMEGSTTTVTFSEADPATVTMLRYGSVTTTLVFEQERRHICVYETPIMPFEICIYARRVENGLTMDGGDILLDYLIEIHGAKAERTRFELHVTPTEQ